MKRVPQLPCLPGYSVNYNVGQTRFHLSNHLQYIHEGVPYFTSKALPGVGGAPLPGAMRPTYPSIYARGEVTELPAWIVFDKHILRFDAFWLESSAFPEDENRYFIHKCVVYFFLEDGTVKVVEPKVRNSGLPQGCLVNRQRIRFSPDSNSNDYYDIIDFNIGKEIVIYGRKFTLVDCDKFTRQFLNRLGIQVPDPIVVPEDPYTKKREKMDGVPEKKRVGKTEAFDSMTKMDNRILGFKAYWDDRGSQGGYFHLLKLSYFLIDGTVEVSDVTDPDNHFILVKRMKLPMEYKGLSMPGDDDSTTLLNVIGDGKRKNRYIADPLNTGKCTKDYYRDKDIVIGAVINSFGRKFVIYDCDNFTKEYYRVKFGLDDFTPAPRPLTKEEESLTAAKDIEPLIAPYNGFGSYEDSLRNCLTVHPSDIVKSMKQFYEKDKFGYESNILRFSAVMLSKDPIYHGRRYIISYFLSDDTINVFHGDMTPNTGVNGGMMVSRRQIMKPGQNIYSNKPPVYYTHQDLFIGNTLELESYVFHIVGADEYALRYMENHPNEFPKSNVRLILDKVRQAIKPVYKEFAAQFIKDSQFQPVPFPQFREAILKILPDNITEHEVLILARHYADKVQKEKYSTTSIRRYAQDTLKRELFDDFQALREGFLHQDSQKEGYVCRKTAYSVLRGAKVPLDVELIQLILEKLGKGPECLIYYDEFIDFINHNTHPVPPIQPINISVFGHPPVKSCNPYKTETIIVRDILKTHVGSFDPQGLASTPLQPPSALSWQNLSRPEPHITVSFVCIKGVIDDLQLENELKQESA